MREVTVEREGKERDRETESEERELGERERVSEREESEAIYFFHPSPSHPLTKLAAIVIHWRRAL